MFDEQPQLEIDALIKTNPEFKQLYQRHRALDLALDDHRVDEPPRVVAGPVAEDADERGEGIHLDEGDVGARRIRHVGGLEEARALEARIGAEGCRRRARQRAGGHGRRR